MKNIAVLGAGALGAMFAEKLSSVSENRVYFIAEGERYKRLLRNPITVNGKQFSYTIKNSADVTQDGNQEGDQEGNTKADLLLVAVKYHHLKQALEDATPHVGNNTLMISVMNGIDSEKIMEERFNIKHPLYTIAVGMDAVREGHHIHYSNLGKLIFGRAKNEKTYDDVRTVQEIFDQAHIPWETRKDMIKALWWKWMINIGINQGTALLKVPYSVFQQSEHAKNLMLLAMREVITVAKEEHIDLGEKDLENWYSILHSLSPEGKTSMCQDIEAGRKTEIEMFAGKLLDLGKKHHISTPVNETFFHAIKILENLCT